MIKKLKIFAFAMLATGATVANTKASTSYESTNVLQSVTTTLTVYGQKTGSQTTLGTGAAASYKTANLVAAVEAGLGGTNIQGNHFGTKATLDLLTYETVSIPATTNPAVTNVLTNTSVLVTNSTVVTNITSSPSTLVLNTNTVALLATTTNVGVGTNALSGSGAITSSAGGVSNFVTSVTNNVTLGDTFGNYVTVTATNGTTNLTLNTVNGLTGPTNVSYATNSFTYDANQTAIIGTNTPVPVETNAVYTNVSGGQPTNVAIDASSLVVFTNGVPIVTNVIGTNTYTIATNSVVSTNGTTNTLVVTVGTNVTTVTNSVMVGTNAPTVVSTNTVDIVSASDTNVVVGTNELGASTNTDSLTTTFTVVTNVATFTTNTTFVTNTGVSTNEIVTTNETIATNLAIVTETAAYTASTNVSTNLSTNFLITTNVTGPITNAATNIIGGAASVVIAEVVGTGASATPVYTPVPPAILSITNMATPNDIISDTATVTSDWTIKRLFLNTTTNAVTNVTVAAPVMLTLQGLVHSTRDNVTVASALTAAERSKISVTNEAWTDVTGYGTNNGVPIVVGGTVTVGSPVLSKVPGTP
jgi:hypothetical protein